MVCYEYASEIIHMTPEQYFFIEILNNHLAGVETKFEQDVDWNTVLAYARMHQVEGIIYYQCKRIMPLEMRAFLDRKFGVTLFYFKNEENALKEIIEAFERTSIPYFTVKGLDIARCYPVPEMRTMGDLDIIVHEKDKQKAGEALELLGYSSSSEKAPDYDWSYSRHKVHVELHHQLFYIEPGIDKKHADFFNACWDYIENGKLNWNFHFLFIMAHLQKHFIHSGVGFRMFMDLAAIIKNDPGLDWKWIEEKLENLKMRQFTRVCISLCEKWFGVRAPIRCEMLDEAFIEEATGKILANGVFGFSDINNKDNVTISRIVEHGKLRNISRAQMILRHLFPRYIHMRYIPYYSFVEGKPWLLPVAWTYRFIRFMIGKTDNTSAFLDSVNLSDEEVDLREKELKRWGLLQ